MEQKKDIAYTEINCILKQLPKWYNEKIPQKLKSKFNENENKEYKPQIILTHNLKKQNLQPLTLRILTVLKYNYWCKNINEKEKIHEIFLENEKKYNEKAKYNNDIFKNNKLLVVNKEENIIKEKWYLKLIKKIKNSLWRNK